MARRKNLNEEESQENKQNNDDTFGLPEIEYEPLKREQEQPKSEPVSASNVVNEGPQEQTIYEKEVVREEVQNDYAPAFDEEEERSPWPRILGILALLLVLGGGAYWFFGVYRPKQEAEKARLAQQAKEDEERRAQQEREAAERQRAEAEQRRADSLANLKPATGTIETLNDRTGRYYAVIASAVDGDLIMDHAQRLSAKGVSSKIIPPFGKAKFYRLAIAEGDNYNDTQTTADGLKGEYGGEVWVVKY
jgi:phosphoglycolate phosphatase-like HAD superfamily hydrolase